MKVLHPTVTIQVTELIKKIQDNFTSSLFYHFRLFLANTVVQGIYTILWHRQLVVASMKAFLYGSSIKTYCELVFCIFETCGKYCFCIFDKSLFLKDVTLNAAAFFG